MKSNRRSAFSLLELAIVMVIIAVMFTVATVALKSQLSSADTTSTKNKLATLQKALDMFYLSNNRYPCPAAANIAESSASYGVEASSCLSSSCPSGMFCGTRSVRGAIPFVTLGLANNFGADDFGSKISYAIDYAFTIKNGNCESGGGLTIKDANSNTIIDTAVYALISHGKDKAGAYDAKTTNYTACISGHADGENCNSDDIFTDSVINDLTTTTAQLYDDIMLWSLNPKRKTCPAGLRDCRLWLDSSDRCSIDLNTTEVTQWRSKGTYKYFATQGTLSTMPTFVTTAASLLNGRSYIKFVSGDLMTVSNSATDNVSSFGDSAYTQAIVFRSTDTAGVLFALADSSSYTATTIDRNFNLNSSKLAHNNYNAASEVLTSTANFNDGIAHIAISSLSATSAHALWIDRSLVTTGTQLLSSFTTKTNALIGGHTSLGYYDGDILEIIYFDYALSTTERQALENYLAIKWGLNI